MDDLLQSLGFSGHGTSTRPQATQDESVLGGAAFGMAFAKVTLAPDTPQRRANAADNLPVVDAADAEDVADIASSDQELDQPEADLSATKTAVPLTKQPAIFQDPSAHWGIKPEGTVLRTTGAEAPLVLPARPRANLSEQPLVLPGASTIPLRVTPQIKPPATQPQSADTVQFGSAMRAPLQPGPRAVPSAVVLEFGTGQEPPSTGANDSPATARNLASIAPALADLALPKEGAQRGRDQLGPTVLAQPTTSLQKIPNTPHDTVPGSRTSPQVAASTFAIPTAASDMQDIPKMGGPRTPPSHSSIPTIDQTLPNQTAADRSVAVPTSTPNDGSLKTDLSRPSVAQITQHSTPQITQPVAANPLFPLEAQTPEPALQDHIDPRDKENPPLRTGSWTPTFADPASVTGPNTSPTVVHFGTQSIAPIVMATLPEALDSIEFGLQTVAQSASILGSPGAVPMPHAPTANAQAMAQQIATALSEPGREPGGMVELSLDPPELGRLRMQMVEVAGVMTLMIQAERPETAELLRRHLDLLAQEFADAGLDAPSVHISQEGAGQDDADAREDAPDGRPHQTLTEDASLQSPPPQRTASGALDLRL